MTTGGNKTFVFVTTLQRPVVDAVCMPVISSLQRAIDAEKQIQATKVKQGAELQRQQHLQDQTSAIAAAVRRPVSVADELKKLADLRDSGVLSGDEFEAQKARLLSQ
jgi:hypothetical protein